MSCSKVCPEIPRVNYFSSFQLGPAEKDTYPKTDKKVAKLLSPPTNYCSPLQIPSNVDGRKRIRSACTKGKMKVKDDGTTIESMSLTQMQKH